MKKLIYFGILISLLLTITGCIGESEPPLTGGIVTGSYPLEITIAEEYLNDPALLYPPTEKITDLSEVEALIEIIPNNFNLKNFPEYTYFTVTNLSDETVKGGCRYDIEYHNGTEWKKAIFPKGGVPDLALVFEPDVPHKVQMNLKPQNNWIFDKKLKTGTYRVVYHGHCGEFTIS